MKKLEDIPKKDPFQAPEGYFERLPGIIQARVAPREGEQSNARGWIFYFYYSLRYAAPALLIVVAAFFYLNRPAPQSVEEQLASIDSVSLVAYLEETDVSTDDLLENVSIDTDEASAIEQDSLGEINLDEEDVEDLSNEFASDYF